MSLTSNESLLKCQKLTNPVSTFGVSMIFDPFTMPFSVNVPSCRTLEYHEYFIILNVYEGGWR